MYLEIAFGLDKCKNNVRMIYIIFNMNYEIDYNLNFTFGQSQKREVRAALSNTFGFGGHNACVIFKKYVE